jgi:hypothetical protein
MARKTIAVENLVEWANGQLARKDSEFVNASFRKGIAALVEHFLMETGNYRGFNYVEWAKEGGYERWAADGKQDDTTPYLGDQTRIMFY